MSVDDIVKERSRSPMPKKDHVSKREHKAKHPVHIIFNVTFRIRFGQVVCCWKTVFGTKEY